MVALWAIDQRPLSPRLQLKPFVLPFVFITYIHSSSMVTSSCFMSALPCCLKWSLRCRYISLLTSRKIVSWVFGNFQLINTWIKYTFPNALKLHCQLEILAWVNHGRGHRCSSVIQIVVLQLAS